MALGGDCMLCGEAAGERRVCRACERSMPRLVDACPQCAQPMALSGLCGACLRKPPPFADAVAPFRYAFPVDRLVLRYKGGADFAAGRWLAEALAEAVRERPRPEVLVATPLRAGRLRERGFNQALWAAQVVGGRLGIPVDAGALAKTRDTAAQAGLDLEARRRNLRHAFACGRRFDGRHVALVDDVITTGSTAAGVADALREAGARTVSVWALARTPGPAGAGRTLRGSA